jgi:hypothetical protein
MDADKQKILNAYQTPKLLDTGQFNPNLYGGGNTSKKQSVI